MLSAPVGLIVVPQYTMRAPKTRQLPLSHDVVKCIYFHMTYNCISIYSCATQKAHELENVPRFFFVLVCVTFVHANLCTHKFTTLSIVDFRRVGERNIRNVLELQIINVLWCWKNLRKDLKKATSLTCIFRWNINLFRREKCSACYQN